MAGAAVDSALEVTGMSDSDLELETRRVSGFSRVVLCGVGVLRIVQGDSESLTVEAAPDLLPRITSEVDAGTLTLGVRRGAWLKGLSGGTTVRFGLTMKDIEGITLAGAGDVVCDGVASDRLELIVSGAGSLTVKRLDGASLGVLLSGAGGCEVSGDVGSQDIRITGAGSYRARSLHSKVAKVCVAGAGSVVVSVDDTLDAHVTGTGSVTYHGEPTVFRRVTGTGRIKFAGG